MKKFTFITAALAALALISCQKENMPLQTNPQEDVWEIEIEGQTTKADITKTMILIVKPNESITATLKKNKKPYIGSDVNWSWTGGNVKATRTGDGSKTGVSTCSLTANTSGSETVYVTATVDNAPGANIPTRSANVVVNEAMAVIKVTQESIPSPGIGDRLVFSLDFSEPIQGFPYNGENLTVTCSAETVLLQNECDKSDQPSKPNSQWRDGGSTWFWQNSVSKTSTFSLNATSVGYCDLDYSVGTYTGYGSSVKHYPYPASGSKWGNFTVSSNDIDHVEDEVYNLSTKYELK